MFAWTDDFHTHPDQILFPLRWDVQVNPFIYIQSFSGDQVYPRPVDVVKMRVLITFSSFLVQMNTNTQIPPKTAPSFVHYYAHLGYLASSTSPVADTLPGE